MFKQNQCPDTRFLCDLLPQRRERNEKKTFLCPFNSINFFLFMKKIRKLILIQWKFPFKWSFHLCDCWKFFVSWTWIAGTEMKWKKKMLEKLANMQSFVKYQKTAFSLSTCQDWLDYDKYFYLIFLLGRVSIVKIFSSYPESRGSPSSSSKSASKHLHLILVRELYFANADDDEKIQINQHQVTLPVPANRERANFNSL